MINPIKPTSDEIAKWMLSTLKHSCHVEYFWGKLGLGNRDPERPHDIIGVGSKYSVDVVRGFALLYREPKLDFQTYISPAREMHRQQYHHRMWNQPSPKATREDMLAGAVDTVCGNLENRDYHGGPHSYGEILKIIEKSHPRQIEAVKIIIPEMWKLEQPNLEKIIVLSEFPNIGLSDEAYEEIVLRTQEASKMLEAFMG